MEIQICMKKLEPWKGKHVSQYEWIFTAQSSKNDLWSLPVKRHYYTNTKYGIGTWSKGVLEP